MILGKNDHERQEIEDHINACYELRSRIVHGGSVEAVAIREKASKLEEILRKSILNTIRARSKEDMLELMTVF